MFFCVLFLLHGSGHRRGLPVLTLSIPSRRSSELGGGRCRSRPSGVAPRGGVGGARLGRQAALISQLDSGGVAGAGRDRGGDAGSEVALESLAPGVGPDGEPAPEEVARLLCLDQRRLLGAALVLRSEEHTSDSSH